MRAYLYGILIGLDQFAGTLIPGGFADETLSSRMGRRIKRIRKSNRRAVESEVICAVLDVIDKDHCADAIEETPEGETDPHHLGRVIRELPRDPATRLHKVPSGDLPLVIQRTYGSERKVPQ